MREDSVDAILAPRAGAGLEREAILHEVEWTPERIRRFWDELSSNSMIEDSYFSKARGRALIDFIDGRVSIGTALDMGCGRGDLIGYLIDRHEAMGADQSPESVEAVNRRFANHPHFRGAFIGTADIPDAIADTLFIIEVVEHLDDHTLDLVLSEARRLLKPGGNLVLTTPNDEDLEANRIVCPECGCRFHRWQHVRKWTTDSLTDYLERFGFEGTATATLLSNHNGVKRKVHKIYHRLRRHPLPHMVYIGSPTE